MPPALRDDTILLTPSAQGEVFHFCIGNQGTDPQLRWLGWLRLVPTRDLSAAMVPPGSSSREASTPQSLWLVRAAIAMRCQKLLRPEVVQGSASSSPAGSRRGKRWAREGCGPAFSCKPKVGSAGFWHRRAQRNRDCGRDGAEQVGADPRLGQTQGTWAKQGLSLTSVFPLRRTLHCVFEVAALKPSEV